MMPLVRSPCASHMVRPPSSSILPGCSCRVSHSHSTAAAAAAAGMCGTEYVWGAGGLKSAILSPFPYLRVSSGGRDSWVGLQGLKKNRIRIDLHLHDLISILIFIDSYMPFPTGRLWAWLIELRIESELSRFGGQINGDGQHFSRDFPSGNGLNLHTVHC